MSEIPEKIYYCSKNVRNRPLYASVDYTGDIAPLHIGEFFDCCKYKGLIDEVAFFDVALTADDITSIMNKGLGSMLAVSQSGKLTTTWGGIKNHH